MSGQESTQSADPSDMTRGFPGGGSTAAAAAEAAAAAAAAAGGMRVTMYQEPLPNRFGSMP